MKPFVLSVLFVVFLLPSLHADPPLAQAGRFQLLAGNYGIDEMHRATIIKIDTATGETWELVVSPTYIKGAGGTKGHIDVTGWVPIPANLAAEVQRLLSTGVIAK